MSNRDSYVPSPAHGVTVKKDGAMWTLILVRDLHPHAPEKVWEALTDPEHLREWAPFEADGRMGTAGGSVKLSTVGTPTPNVSETTIKRAEAPRLLEYSWGGGNLRWELEPLNGGTRLTLWHSIDPRFVAWGAAGWHICLDVLQKFLAAEPIGRIAGVDVKDFAPWQELTKEYALQFRSEQGD